MATGNVIFLHSLGATAPRPPRVVPANLNAQLDVRSLNIHSTIKVYGQMMYQGPSPIVHNCSDRDPGIVLSQVISTPFNATITTVATSLDGRYLAIGDDHGRVEVHSQLSSNISVD